MKEFVKYKSIMNHYEARSISGLLNKFPQLSNLDFVVYEKIDGANLQIIFTPGEKEFTVGKRKSFISKEDNFFDVWNTLDKYKEELNTFQQMANGRGEEIKIYGELYGKGINGRVDYGPEKYFKVFDIYIDGYRQVPSAVDDILGWAAPIFKIPMLGKVSGVAEALKFNENFDSKILNKEGNLAEGVVVRPWFINIETSEEGDIFIIKKKSVNFAEKEQAKHLTPSLHKFDCNLFQYQAEFEELINENRLLSFISKEGDFSQIKQMGKYIVGVVEDAKEDFIKQYPDLNLTEKDWKFVFRAGHKKCAYVCKDYLKNKEE